MTNWEEIRAEFPALTNWTYLNTATFGQMPLRGRAAVARHLARRDEFACSDFIEWFDDLQEIRGACARLIHGEADDIAFVVSASAGLSILMQGLDWKAGDEVLTLENEFPNQAYAGASMERFGVKHRMVAWKDFYQNVTDRTRLVALSTVNYATGFRPPLEEIADFLRPRGTLLYLDATQSLGALELDVRKIRPAMLCADAYKWLFSPNGVGFVYVSPELRPSLPPTSIGWRSDRNWRRVDSLNQGTPEFAESAEKYEGGWIPVGPAYAMGAALEMMFEIGPATVEARVLELADKARSILRALGAEVNEDRSQIVTAVFAGRDSSELAQALKEKRILVAARNGRLRVSPHIYNNEQDLETLGKALATML